MAGGQERILRRRIKSIQSTKKITKAMELIAASQIVRAQGRIAAAKPYQEGMARIVLETALGDPTAAGRLLGAPEHDGSRSTPIDYDAWPFYRQLGQARAFYAHGQAAGLQTASVAGRAHSR